MLQNILYVASFLVVLYYLIQWTKTNAALQSQFAKEKERQKEKVDIVDRFEDTDKASRANCAGWSKPVIKTDAYNDADTNEFEHLDPGVRSRTDGAAINAQAVAKAKQTQYNTIVAAETVAYKAKVATYLDTGNNRTTFFKLPPMLSGGTAQTLTTWLDNPATATFHLVDPTRTTTYATTPWFRIYNQLLVYRQEFVDAVNTQTGAGFSSTYPQIANAPEPDPIRGTNYYPLDRHYLNDEAYRRYTRVKELDKQVLSNEDFKAKWGWVDKIGEQMALPAEFKLSTGPDTIRDAQSRSVMDILTDYDPTQFGCQRIYQECGTRVAPGGGYAQDIYDDKKYDFESIEPLSTIAA